MCASTKPGISKLSPCSMSCAPEGRRGSSSRAGPAALICPSLTSSSPSSKNTKLPGSSSGPGSARKYSSAPRCAHGLPVVSVWRATLDPGEHFGPLLIGDPGHVSHRHGARGDLLTHLLGAREDL